MFDNEVVWVETTEDGRLYDTEPLPSRRAGVRPARFAAVPQFVGGHYAKAAKDVLFAVANDTDGVRRVFETPGAARKALRKGEHLIEVYQSERLS